MMSLLIPEHLKRELDAESRERGKTFVNETIGAIAEKYHSKMPLLNEFWIFIAAKRDKRSGNLNAYIKAVDRDHLHKVNTPMQGAQLWYINWKTGEKRLEWILPLQAKKSQIDTSHYICGNRLIQDSLLRADRALGKNLATGK